MLASWVSVPSLSVARSVPVTPLLDAARADDFRLLKKLFLLLEGERRCGVAAGGAERRCAQAERAPATTTQAANAQQPFPPG